MERPPLKPFSLTIFYPCYNEEANVERVTRAAVEVGRQITADLVTVADPTLIKLLLSRGKIAGFLFGFPDLSAALQRSRGHLTPWGIIDLLLEYRRTKWLIVNGAGILPQYQRLGGNALLYYMLEKVASRKRFLHVDAVQIAESTELMLSDMQTLGGKVYKRHRVYKRPL